MDVSHIISLDVNEQIIRVTPPVTATMNRLVITNKRLFEIGTSPDKIIWECYLENILKVTNLAVVVTIVEKNSRSHTYIAGLYYSTVIANELRNAIANASSGQQVIQRVQKTETASSTPTNMNKAVCPHCGFAENKPDAHFCSRCGTKLEVVSKHVCPSCGYEDTDADAHFCPVCGTKLEEE